MATDNDGVFDELSEPGVFSGLLTLLGGALGIFLVAYNYFYGPGDGIVASSHWALVIGIGALFSFLLAAFTFLIGWIVEIVWPLLGALVIVGLLIGAPLVLYFGLDQVTNEVSRALMFG